jgi:hypothetical protein
VLLGAVLGFVLPGLRPEKEAVAQTAPAVTTPRFQISAYAGSTPQGIGHGCYIIDTVTGQVWHARQGGLAEKVADKLR